MSGLPASLSTRPLKIGWRRTTTFTGGAARLRQHAVDLIDAALGDVEHVGHLGRSGESSNLPSASVVDGSAPRGSTFTVTPATGASSVVHHRAGHRGAQLELGVEP